jgi:hypothetical protein
MSDHTAMMEMDTPMVKMDERTAFGRWRLLPNLKSSKEIEHEQS